jgi:hypothetical protein
MSFCCHFVFLSYKICVLLEDIVPHISVELESLSPQKFVCLLINGTLARDFNYGEVGLPVVECN